MRANEGQGGTVKFVRQAIEARGFVWGGLGDSSLQLSEGEGDLEAITLFWGELGQVVKELGEDTEIRSKGVTAVDWVISRVGGGDVAALEDGREEAENLLLNRSLRGQYVPIGQGSGHACLRRPCETRQPPPLPPGVHGHAGQPQRQPMHPGF